MGDEQHPSRADLLGVESGEPGFTEAGCQHHQAAPVALAPCVGECRQGVVLDWCGRRWRIVFVAAGCDRSRRRDAARLVVVDPGVVELNGAWRAEQFFEAGAGFDETVVTGVVDAVIPFQPVSEGRATDVAGADEHRAVHRAGLGEVGEQIGLHVKAASARLEDPHLRAVFLEQHQQPQCLGVGDVEIVAGKDADARGGTRFGGLALERVVQIGQQQAQPASFDEGHRQVDLVRARDRVAKLRQEGMLRLAGEQTIGRQGLAPQKRVEPPLAPFWSLVFGDPAFGRFEFVQVCRPLGKALFVGIGELPLAVVALALAMLEAEIEHAAGLEAGPQAGEGGGQFRCRHVEQAGASPDTVVTGALGDVVEALHLDRLADEFLREVGEFGRGVEGAHAQAGVDEGLAVTPRAAAGVEDEPARRDVGEEASMQVGHVHVRRVRDEASGINVVVAQGAGHGRGWAERYADRTQGGKATRLRRRRRVGP